MQCANLGCPIRLKKRRGEMMIGKMRKNIINCANGLLIFAEISLAVILVLLYPATHSQNNDGGPV